MKEIVYIFFYLLDRRWRWLALCASCEMERERSPPVVVEPSKPVQIDKFSVWFECLHD
jgi:hypothetical protein